WFVVCSRSSRSQSPSWSDLPVLLLLPRSFSPSCRVKRRCRHEATWTAAGSQSWWPYPRPGWSATPSRCSTSTRSPRHTSTRPPEVSPVPSWSTSTPRPAVRRAAASPTRPRPTTSPPTRPTTTSTCTTRSSPVARCEVSSA
ncbi:MAG: hypothetical protein AVDCRST_MAG10-989, partial [uncultured Acidimicrobiales bacterium]